MPYSRSFCEKSIAATGFSFAFNLILHPDFSTFLFVYNEKNQVLCQHIRSSLVTTVFQEKKKQHKKEFTHIESQIVDSKLKTSWSLENIYHKIDKI